MFCNKFSKCEPIYTIFVCPIAITQYWTHYKIAHFNSGNFV